MFGYYSWNYNSCWFGISPHDFMRSNILSRLPSLLLGLYILRLSILNLYVRSFYIHVLYIPNFTYKLHYLNTLPYFAYILHIPLHQNLTFMIMTNMTNDHFLVIHLYMPCFCVSLYSCDCEYDYMIKSLNGYDYVIKNLLNEHHIII